MKFSSSAKFGYSVAVPIWLALAVVGLAQQSSGDWRTVTDVTGRFSFSLPAEPEHQAHKDESHKEGPILTDIYLLKPPPNLYLAGFTDYPPAAPLPDQEELNLDRDNFNKQVNATIISEERKTYAGFPALEFKSKNDTTSFHTLIVKADHHVYQLVAGYPNGDEPLQCGKFVNSLKLIKP